MMGKLPMQNMQQISELEKQKSLDQLFIDEGINDRQLQQSVEEHKIT